MERAENTHGLRDPNLVPIVLGIFPRWRARSAVVKWTKVAHPTNDGKGHQNQTERKFRSSERVLAFWTSSLLNWSVVCQRRSLFCPVRSDLVSALPWSESPRLFPRSWAVSGLWKESWAETGLLLWSAVYSKPSSPLPPPPPPDFTSVNVHHHQQHLLSSRGIHSVLASNI